MAEHSAIAKVWYRLVKSGKKTIDEVPERWRAEVQEMLDEDGSDVDA